MSTTVKITIITDPAGEILATHRRLPSGVAQGKAQGAPVLGLAARQGNTAHEIELPSHLENVKSAEELHRELKKHLQARQQGKKP